MSPLIIENEIIRGKMRNKAKVPPFNFIDCPRPFIVHSYITFSPRAFARSLRFICTLGLSYMLLVSTSSMWLHQCLSQVEVFLDIRSCGTPYNESTTTITRNILLHPMLKHWSGNEVKTYTVIYKVTKCCDKNG